jgi:predicted LPLAT superfamily acyltransferase
MRQLITVGVILMLACLGGLFAWFAAAIRRDSRDRFQRIQQHVEAQASTIVRDLFSEAKARADRP